MKRLQILLTDWLETTWPGLKYRSKTIKQLTHCRLLSTRPITLQYENADTLTVFGARRISIHVVWCPRGNSPRPLSNITSCRLARHGTTGRGGDRMEGMDWTSPGGQWEAGRHGASPDWWVQSVRGTGGDVKLGSPSSPPSPTTRENVVQGLVTAYFL